MHDVDPTGGQLKKEKCATGLDGLRIRPQSEARISAGMTPVSRLGRLSVSMFTAARTARSNTPALMTTTGMTITGPSRAGTG